MPLPTTKTKREKRKESLLPGIPLLGSSLLGSSFMDDFLMPDWAMDVMGEGFNTEWVPSANIIEKEKEFLIELSVPGYAKNDIMVEVDEDNCLHVSGERKDESKAEKENYTCREFRHDSFTRSFQLPETIKHDKVTATCSHGILSVDLPKKEATLLKAKSKQIKIA